MKHIALTFVAALFMTACTMSDPVEFSGDLSLGKVVEGRLELETPDSYYFDFGADTYVYGVCEQLTVDVVVSLYDSAGASLGKFDGPGEGPEEFYFEISRAGRYRLEIAPFEKKTGAYTLELKIVEPVATDPVKRADQLMYPYTGDDVPGGVIGVIRDGELIFSKAYGMADLSYGIPFTVATPSNIGSVSKQFTAMAILLLEQEGKLSLDDDVRKYIPELPDLGKVVKIKNLLNHTNGFREVYNLMPMTGWKGEDVLLREEVIGILKRQEKLQAAPGEEFNYNNSAFIMLAEIVERISGQSFPEFMEEHVFAPLGMNSTMVRTNPVTIVPGASQGYTRDSTGYIESGDLYAAYGAGGIYTTPGDFSKWMDNFSDPVVGGKEVIARLVRVDTLNNGDTMAYAQGLDVNEFKGLMCYSHSGADLAHRAFAMYFPEINAGVVAMSNNASFPSGMIANTLAEAFFADELELEEEEAKTEAGEKTQESAEVVVPESVLQAFAGKYILSGRGFILEYSVVEGKLMRSIEGRPDVYLTPLSQSEFRYEGEEATVAFITDDQGKATGAVHSQDGQEYILEALPPYEPSLEKLQACEGSYFSRELDVFYHLELHDSTLVLLIRNTPEIKLSVLREDVYKGDVDFIGELAFVKDDEGSVSGFEVSNGRTRGIHFERD